MKKQFILSILITLCAHTLYAQVNFQDLDWNAALKKAAKEKKYIMTDCYTDWCYWCKVMDKKTFSDTEVGKFANEHFVAIKIDMEKDFGRALGKKYHVNGYPTYFFFTSKGELVYTISGFQPPADFLASLNKAITPSEQTHLKGYSTTIQLTYPDFYGRDTLPSETELNSYLDKQKNLFGEVNWAVISRYSGMSEKYSQFLLDNRKKYRELFGDEVVNDILYRKFEKQLDSAIIKKDEALLQHYLDNRNKYELNRETDAEQNIRMYFYSATHNYKKLMSSMQEWIKSTGNDTAEMLNNYCWRFYTSCDDPQLVHDAALIMEKVANTHGFAEKDTYASLLFKDKQYEKAEQEAIKAIEAGKKEDWDYSPTEKLLGYARVMIGKDIVYGKRSDCDYAVILNNWFFPVCPTVDTIKTYDLVLGDYKDTVIFYNGMQYESYLNEPRLKNLPTNIIGLFSIKGVRMIGRLSGKLVITYADNSTPYEVYFENGTLPTEETDPEIVQKITHIGKGDVMTFKNLHLNDGSTVLPTEIKLKLWTRE